MIIRNILILTVIAALVPTAMPNVSASTASEIALFSSDSDSLSISGNEDNAKMKLKATNENGKTNKVSDFQLNADNVLYIKVGDKATVKDKVDFTKAIAIDGNNNQKVIGITSNGVIDFTGYTQGVSTLDVVITPEPEPITPEPGDPVDPCSIDPTGPDCEAPELPIEEPAVLPLVGENTVEELPYEEEWEEGSETSEEGEIEDEVEEESEEESEGESEEESEGESEEESE
jgi:hypothetical protein